MIHQHAKSHISSVLFYLTFSFALVLFFLSWITSRYNPFPFQTFVIQSGSMEPSIMTGDIILIKKQDRYQLKDVVTFNDQSDRVVTHRIIEIKNNQDREEFVTQGDANQSPDIHPIDASQVKGKVAMVVPKLGFAVAFAQSRVGIAVLIGVPVVLVIYDELKKILAEMKK